MTTDKKKVLKRLLSMTLALVLCLSLLPVPARAASGTTLTNGMPVTEENVLALIEEYRNGKGPGEKAKEAGFTSYVRLSKYDAKEPPYYCNALRMNGVECAKFAYAFWDDLFGDLPMREITNTEVRPGDLLHFDGHWAIATLGASYDYQPGALCVKRVSGGAAGEISWGNMYYPLDAGNLLAAYTRYPETWEFDDTENILASVTAPIGTPFEALELDSFAKLGAHKGSERKTVDVPISWDSSNYDPWATTQTITGELDMSDFPEFNGAVIPKVATEITLEGEIGIKDVQIDNSGTIFSKVGAVWSELEVPSSLPVTVTYENNEKSEIGNVSVEWDVGSYVPSQMAPQTIKGTVLIGSGPVSELPGEWIDKLEAADVEVEIVLRDSASGLTVLGEPFEVLGHFGDRLTDIAGVPNAIRVSVNLASGTPSERELGVLWDESSYDATLPTQSITGKLDVSGYGNLKNLPASEIPTVTLTITLIRDEKDPIERIELISPTSLNGTTGVAFENQNFPKEVAVRVVFSSGYAQEYTVPVTWQSDGFDSSLDNNETQQVTGTLSFADGIIPADTAPELLKITLNAFMRTRGTGIEVPEIPVITGYLGATWDELKQKGIPGLLTVVVTKSNGEKVTLDDMLVNWNSSTYDPNLENQIIHGTLALNMFSITNGMTSPDVQLTIRLSDKSAFAQDFVKAYDKKATPLSVTKPEGCESVNIQYSGKTAAGVSISGTRTPTEAGDYTATVSFTMKPGYAVIEPFAVSYIINPAE